jgi:hypothetical protein
MRGAVEVGLATVPTGSRVLDPMAEATPLRPAAGRHRGYLLCRKQMELTTSEIVDSGVSSNTRVHGS